MSVREKRLLCLVVSLLLFVVFGCGSITNRYRYKLNDKELLPYKSMYKVDREQYCLTEIDPDSQVRIEKTTCPGEGCDVKLHLRSDQTNADTDRVITFIWEDDEYVWIGEQETHCSGQTFMHPDGEIEECITIIYRARKFDYSGSTGLSILYNGIDENIPPWPLLTCEQALSIIRVWDAE